MPAADIAVAQSLAHATTIAVLQDQATKGTQRRTAQLQHALNSRVIIEQAKGALAARADIDTDEAFSLLRAYAPGNNIKLTTWRSGSSTGDCRPRR